MDDILNLSINEMPLIEFDCSCGRRHSFPVSCLEIGKGAILKLPEVAKPFKDGKVLVVCDSNIYKIAGAKAIELLKEDGFNVKELVFETGSDILLPDEKTLGRILMEQDLDVNLMVAVGSGVMNDSVKFVTSRTKLPYIVVATAPSMDGYVADGAPIIKAGYKLSPLAHLTYGIVGDTDILQTAPIDLVQAGFGDVVGKITALADWDLSEKIAGEYGCNTCKALVKRALDKCFDTAAGLKTRDPKAIGNLMEALTLSGVSMALINLSRPASGAEHMLSHYWEMDYIARGLNPIHHGIQVGVATPVIARVFEELEDILPEGTIDLLPSHQEIEELLKKGGAPFSPAQIGISRELFHKSLLEGHAVRSRYSILKYALENERLDEIADTITKEIYD